MKFKETFHEKEQTVLHGEIFYGILKIRLSFKLSFLRRKHRFRILLSHIYIKLASLSLQREEKPSLFIIAKIKKPPQRWCVTVVNNQNSTSSLFNCNNEQKRVTY